MQKLKSLKMKEHTKIYVIIHISTHKPITGIKLKKTIQTLLITV